MVFAIDFSILFHAYILRSTHRKDGEKNLRREEWSRRLGHTVLGECGQNLGYLGGWVHGLELPILTLEFAVQPPRHGENDGISGTHPPRTVSSGTGASEAGAKEHWALSMSARKRSAMVTISGPVRG